MLLKLSLVIPCLCLLQTAAAFQNFEVATIKPNAANDNRVMLQFQPGGRFAAAGISLKQLVAFAYDMRDFQISGGSGWLNDDRYEINAKSEALTSDRPNPEMARKVMKNFLAERFQVKAQLPPSCPNARSNMTPASPCYRASTKSNSSPAMPKQAEWAPTNSPLSYRT